MVWLMKDVLKVDDVGICVRFTNEDFDGATRIIVVNECAEPIIHTTLYVDEMRPSTASHILEELNNAYVDTVKLKQERAEHHEHEEYLRLKQKYGNVNG